jgi:hypothetical protein
VLSWMVRVERVSVCVFFVLVIKYILVIELVYCL